MHDRHTTREGIIDTSRYVVPHVKHKDMAQLRTECIDGNDRACETLEAVCERGDDDACRYVPR